MAKAILFAEMGAPDVLRLADVAIAPPAAGEALVEMRSIGVNRSDALFRSGKYLSKPNLPCGLGIEGAGIVRALGAGVTGFSVGDRVSILPAFAQGGKYATYVTEGLFPATSLLAAPAALNDDEAAALWVSLLTAWGALVELGRLGKGDFVLVSAASSSVGLAAIQIAHAVGAIPIATTRTRRKLDALKKAGATHVIVSEEQDVAASVRDITGSKGLRIAFDAIAGPFAESLVPCMAEEGIVFFYGGLSDQPTHFDRRPILAKGISFTGYTVGQIIKHPDRLCRGQAFVLEGLAHDTLRPIIDRVFPFAAAAEAHRYMESNTQFGKIVLTLNERSSAPA